MKNRHTETAINEKKTKIQAYATAFLSLVVLIVTIFILSYFLLQGTFEEPFEQIKQQHRQRWC